MAAPHQNPKQGPYPNAEFFLRHAFEELISPDEKRVERMHMITSNYGKNDVALEMLFPNTPAKQRKQLFLETLIVLTDAQKDHVARKNNKPVRLRNSLPSWLVNQETIRTLFPEYTARQKAEARLENTVTNHNNEAITP